MLKVHFQVFFFASKKMQGFSSDVNVDINIDNNEDNNVTVTVLFHLQNYVSVS